MARSVATAQRPPFEGLADSPDSQTLRLILAHITVPSDPIDSLKDARLQEQSTVDHFKSQSIIPPLPSSIDCRKASALHVNLSRQALAAIPSSFCSNRHSQAQPANCATSTQDCNALPPDGSVESSRYLIEPRKSSSPPKFLGTPKPSQRTWPNAQSLRPFHNNGHDVALSGVRTRQLRGNKEKMIDNFDYPLHGSNGSTLSTTQEIDEALYQKYAPVDATADSSKAASLVSTTHDTDELHWTTQSAKSTLQTHPSYKTGDLGHVELVLDQSNPIESPARLGQEVGDIPGPQHESEPPRPIWLAPETPVQPRYPFTKKYGDTIPLGELFSLTQPLNSGGYPNSNLPSSTRPSPDLWNNRPTPQQAASSPLIRRLVQSSLPRNQIFISSSPPRLTDAVNKNNEAINTTLSTKTASVSFSTSSLSRSNAQEPLQIYTSRKDSQELRERQSRLPSDDDDDGPSSDGDIFDDDFGPIRRARRKQQAATREIAAAEAAVSSMKEHDLIEVPSTANGRRRSIQEEYIAQCSGADGRDAQEEETLIVDSQDRLAATGEKDKNKDEENEEDEEDEDEKEGEHGDEEEEEQRSSYEGDMESSPQSSRRAVQKLDNELESITVPVSIFKVRPNPGMTHTRPEEFESPLKRSTPHLLLETSMDGSSPKAPIRKAKALYKETLSSEADAMIPETSPAISQNLVFANIESESPIRSSANNIDFTNIPGFTPDDDATALLCSSDPVQTSAMRRRRRRTVPRPTFDLSQRIERTSRVDAYSHTQSMIEDVGPVTTPPGKHLPNTTRPAPPEECVDPTALLHKRQIRPILPIGLTNALNSDPERSFGIAGDGISKCVSQTRLNQPSEPNENNKSLGSAGRTSQLSTLSSLSSMSSVPSLNNDPINIEASPDAQESECESEAHSQLQYTKSRLEDNTETKEVLGAVKRTRNESTPHRISLTRVTSRATRSSTQKDKTQDLTSSDDQSPCRAVRVLGKLQGEIPSTKSLRVALSTKNVNTRSSKRTVTSGKNPHSSGSVSLTNFPGRENSHSVEPVEVSTLGCDQQLPTSSGRGRPGIFSSMAFSVSYRKETVEKDRILKMIKQLGGRILESGFHELFDDSPSALTTPTKGVDILKNPPGNTLHLLPETLQLGFTCLLADEHSRTAKYMQALALGLPCISGRWVQHCAEKNEVIDWEPYLLAAGNSSFLGGAVRNRNLRPYPAATAKFTECFENRQKLLAGKSIILVTGKGKEKSRRKAYSFLTKALGARRILEVIGQQEAHIILAASGNAKEKWDWLYHDGEQGESEETTSSNARVRKRKRAAMTTVTEESSYPIAKRTKTVCDEYVIQSLILGKLVED
ncbi:MAG: hypothetical protein M1818_004570 [Claussenomyces sp. TS43310]|nr:MAG: hypothetical protein M1818_004570 [Claussenomyces sp. TS43310]